MTRCKYKCVAVVERVSHVWNDEKKFSEQAVLRDAEFAVVTSGSEENKQFFAATPTGSLRIGTYRPDVFQAGKTYYLDLTEAPD